jgi:hypothetical protein
LPTNFAERRTQLVHSVEMRTVVITTAILSTGGAVGVTAAPAAARAPHYDDGQRSTAAYWASTNQFTTPRQVWKPPSAPSVISE